MNRDARARSARRAARDLRRPLGPQRRHRRRPDPRMDVAGSSSIGAVTTAWDTAHAVIATMGDRFVLVRMDSTHGADGSPGGRRSATPATRQQMRAELAAAVGGVHRRMNAEPHHDHRRRRPRQLLAAANLVTLARTGVESDYRGDVIDAHAPEMPTRFAKQLTQIVRGSRGDRHGPRATRCGWRCGVPATRCRRCGWRSSTTCPRIRTVDPDRGAQAAREAAGHRRPPTPGAAHARGAHPRRGRTRQGRRVAVLTHRRHRPQRARRPTKSVTRKVTTHP